MWPFTKTEKRQAPYTDAIVQAIQEQNAASTATTLDPTATGAVALASAIIGRAFASAEVDGYEIDPAILYALGVDLVERGDSCLLEIEGETIRPASWIINGKGIVQDQWQYDIENQHT